MPEWAFAVVWIGGPFVVGLAATAVTRIRWRKNSLWMALIGVVLGCAYVVWAYYASPPSGAPYDGCSDCENYLGRWWEPQFTVFLAVIGYILWLLGVGAGIGATATVNAAHSALRKRAVGS